MADFKQIDQARKVLALEDTATLAEIEEAYRKAALLYHPDRCQGKNKQKCEAMMKKINHAKDILAAYCSGYRYSFKNKEVVKNNLDKAYYEHLRRFYDDFIGGWDDGD